MKSRLAAFVLACLVVVLGGFSEDSRAQISDFNSAINKAGRQRMLSQRMAKAYLQIGQDIDAERSKKILDGSISLFDRQLVELKNFAPTPEIKSAYLNLERAWLAYKDMLVGARPTREGAKKVVAQSDAVLELAQAGAAMLVDLSGSESGPLVGVAGRQRMLSQRMAKLYQAVNWGVAPNGAAAELQKARKDFNVGLIALATAPATTRAIKDEVELSKQQWLFFENALDAGEAADKKVLATNVATTSERLLETMDNITAMFEKLGK